MFATRSADWDTDTVCRLRQLWVEGHSTAEIGRRMGISKNAVVGKAHRLDLPARPSPIRRGFDTPPSPPRRPSCPPLAQLVPLAPPLPHVPDRTSRRPRPAVLPVLRGSSPCCWPIGEPSKPSFHFCGADDVLGKPYCPEHCGLAYRKARRSLKRDVLVTTFGGAAVQVSQGGM
jgi:GcrA cell cycle regulator